MTAVIALTLKNPHSIIICADRLETRDKITFFYDPKKVIKNEGKEYFELNAEYKDKFSVADSNLKIFNIGKRYIFSGSGGNDDLDKVINFIIAHEQKKDLIKKLKNYLIKDFVNNKLFTDANKFLLIDTKNLKMHFFDIQKFLNTKNNNDLYAEIKDEVFIFGDVDESEIASIKIEYNNPVENEIADNLILLFNKLVFSMNHLSIKQPKGTIGSPFVYGFDLWHIKKKGTNKYKLKTNFRWEND